MTTLKKGDLAIIVSDFGISRYADVVGRIVTIGRGPAKWQGVLVLEVIYLGPIPRSVLAERRGEDWVPLAPVAVLRKISGPDVLAAESAPPATAEA